MRARKVAIVIACILAITSGCHSGAAPTPSAASDATVPTTARSSVASDGALTFTSVDCNSIGDDEPPAGYLVVGGSVSLPDPSRTAALGASRDPDPASPRLTYFAKAGLGIHVGKQWRITVPEQAAAHLLVGWGSPATPSSSIGPPPSTCHLPLSTTGWLWFPGGFWTDRPGCYPLVIDAGGRTQQISVGIGKPCPGQNPPQ